MRKRRWLVWILCVMFAMALIGCGKDEPQGTSKEPTKAEEPGNTEPGNTEPGNTDPGNTEPGNAEPGNTEPGNTDPGGNDPGPQEPVRKAETMEEALGHAPEHYDYAMCVSINPEFLLYVTGEEVVGHAPLNEDAAKLEDKVALDGRLLRDAINDIVRFSHQDGYLKDGGDVKVTIVAAKETREGAEELLHKAEAAITESAMSAGVTANPVVQVENTVQFKPEPPDLSGDDPGQPGDDPGQPGDDPEQPGGEPRKEEGCSVCWGTGDCERCNATGKVECMECDHGYVHCTQCGGSGGSAELPCTKCGGTGREIHEGCGGTGMTDCEQCHGTKKCPACGGTGRKPD